MENANFIQANFLDKEEDFAVDAKMGREETHGRRSSAVHNRPIHVPRTLNPIHYFPKFDIQTTSPKFTKW